MFVWSESEETRKTGLQRGANSKEKKGAKGSERWKDGESWLNPELELTPLP